MWGFPEIGLPPDPPLQWDCPIFHYKPSIWGYPIYGYPHFWEYDFHLNDPGFFGPGGWCHGNFEAASNCSHGNCVYGSLMLIELIVRKHEKKYDYKQQLIIISVIYGSCLCICIIIKQFNTSQLFFPSNISVQYQLSCTSGLIWMFCK